MPAIKDILDNLRDEKRFRSIPPEPREGMLDLASNDYMGLGFNYRQYTEEFFDKFPDAAFSSSASRLLSSRQDHHLMLENYLEELYCKPSLLFNSGYHANVGCIGALTLPSTLFLCDRLIHASVVDGLKISGAEFRRFPHNDIAKLRMLLERESGKYERIIVVVESIYSMDGDLASLRELAALKMDFPNILLYVDEAHAFGVRGPKGLGLAEELDIIPEIDILIGTLGKAAASTGAFVVCSEEIKSLFINLARPFIFSTALPPVNAAWSMFMIEKLTGMYGERKRLADISEWFRDRISEISGQPVISRSQIVPLLTGNAERALELAAKIREADILALPIRRPTVPPGGERIRFSLYAFLDKRDFDQLFKILESV